MKHYLHTFVWFFLQNTYKWWPDSLWLKVLYRIKMKRNLNLINPLLYTEKLQWLKLHDRNPLYSKLVDKYEVKQYVKECLGEKYVIPTYGVWNSYDDINFDELPNQFVLKCTHDSGNVWICKDKTSFDKVAAREKLEESLKHNFYWWTREWPYKNVKGRIIAEKYMADDNNERGCLSDYKFYCFNGEPQIMLLATGRSTGHLCFDYYDMQWNKLPLQWDKPNSIVVHDKPKGFNEMIRICRILSKGIPHVRIDLYSILGTIYFGEYTFYDNAGFCNFNPKEWDKTLGDMIRLQL